MHLYSALLCIVVHPKRFTIMWGGWGGLSSTTTSVQHPLGFTFTFTFIHLADAFIQSDLHCIQVTVSTFYQLLLSLGSEPMILALLTPCSTSWATGKLMRQQPQDNGTSALTTHQLQVERRESHRDNQVDGDYKEAMIDKGKWWEFGQDTRVTSLLFTRSAMGFLMTTES